MSNTLKIISKCWSLLEEQVPQQEVTQAPQPAQEPVSGETLDDNEKYIIKILTNAFIFNPTLFDKSKQKFIFNKVDQVRGMVNVPVSKIVDEIKKIIAIDRSLKVESKTLNLLQKYLILFEQPADATEPQQQTSTTELDSTSTKAQAESLSDTNELNLAEIFPLYKELIIKALKHIPTEEELMIVKPVVNEFADSDPEKIVETIQNILSQSLEDKEVEDNLSNA